MINCEYTLCNILCTVNTFLKKQLFICHNEVFLSANSTLQSCKKGQQH